MPVFGRSLPAIEGEICARNSHRRNHGAHWAVLGLQSVCCDVQGAGDRRGRPYCILVPAGDYRRYVTATQRWQLSSVHMQASYQGSRGGFYTTNHALLVLDDPREYRNWSYRSENFVTHPLINILHGFNKKRELLAVIELKPCVPERNFVATLK
jgi:hypothetical protein